MYFYAIFEAIPFHTRGRCHAWSLYLNVCSMHVSRTYFNSLLLSETYTDRRRGRQGNFSNYSRDNRSVPKIFEQFTWSSLALLLINSSKFWRCSLKYLQLPVQSSSWSFWLVNIINKQEVVKISTKFSKFEESREELIRETAKLEQINSSNAFGTLLLPRL